MLFVLNWNSINLNRKRDLTITIIPLHNRYISSQSYEILIAYLRLESRMCDTYQSDIFIALGNRQVPWNIQGLCSITDEEEVEFCSTLVLVSLLHRVFYLVKHYATVFSFGGRIFKPPFYGSLYISLSPLSICFFSGWLRIEENLKKYWKLLFFFPPKVIFSNC